MKGDGGDGRVSRSGGSFCGVKGRKGGLLNMGTLAYLSRNGLSMLAGGASDDGAGPLRLRVLERACPAMGKLSAQQEAVGSIGDVEGPGLHKLSGDECWRLILELGTQWPTWNGAAAPSQATQVLKEERKPPGRPLQRSQDFLELIATRALEALAQTPLDLYGKTAQVSRGMLAPKQTTQEVMDSKRAAKMPPKVTEHAAKAPFSSVEVLASETTSTRPRTAALTIFYDGIVNVCDNIPADKACLIMTFAEKAGVSLNAQALLRNLKCVTPPSRQPGPQKLDDLQHCTTPTNSPSDHGNQQLSVGGMMSDLSTTTHLDQCSNSESPAPATAFKALRFTMKPTSEGNSSRHVTVKPLPNARKNSLARFLDSRKRSRAASSCSSEGGSPKKQVLGDHGGCPSEPGNHQEFFTSGKSTMPSCQDSGMCANCLTASGQAPTTSDAEMDSRVVE